MDPATRARLLALLPRVEERLAGRDVTPGHGELHHYWTRGEGLAKWRTKSHPWTALYHHLLKYMTPERAKRAASKWFIEVFGYAAGSDIHRVESGTARRPHRTWLTRAHAPRTDRR